jgi:anti-sigma factor RsiW
MQPDDRLPPGVHEPCVEVVEKITDYLDGALAADEATLVDQHLSVCDGCRAVLDQWHTVIHLAGRISADDVEALEPSTRADLLAAFRQHHGS